MQALYAPGGPWEATVEYKAPLFRPDREEDYRGAWSILKSQDNGDAS